MPLQTRLSRPVIVAGAGLAGLTAARDLARAGREVVLLDARERTGGRVWTTRFGNGQAGELGGEFIDQGQQEICGLVRDYGLKLIQVAKTGFMHRYRGDDGQYHVSRERPWKALADALDPLIRQYKDADGDPGSAAIREMATFSLRNWLTQRGATPQLHSMADALRGFFLADPDTLSVLPLVQQIVDSGSPADSEMFHIEGGNDRLVEALLADGRPRLLLKHTLRAITRRDDGVVAHVEDGHGALREIEGEAMVVTLPASTLSQVEMSPALPEEQERAIRALRYGRATKVLVQSPRDLFRGRRARAFATDTSLGAFWDSTGGEGTLLTFLAGGVASSQLRAKAHAYQTRVIDGLCWLGMAGEPVTEIETATWEDDPLAGGGYAYFDPAFDPAWRPLLARPAGRLFFAGEHTSADWQGYMNGAVESGIRAAREVGRQ